MQGFMEESVSVDPPLQGPRHIGSRQILIFEFLFEANLHVDQDFREFQRAALFPQVGDGDHHQSPVMPRVSSLGAQRPWHEGACW